jgi:hypothetical protein
LKLLTLFLKIEDMKNLVKFLAILIPMPIVFACVDFINEECNNQSEYELVGTRAAGSNAADYYWLGNEKIPLQQMNDKFYVMYEPVNEGKLNAKLKNAGIMLAYMQEELDNSQFTSIKNFNVKKFSGLKTATIEGDYEKIAPALSHAFYSAPYYKTDIGEGRLTNRFSIALKNEADVKLLAELAKENSVEILGVSELDGWYELACTNLSAGNALEMANLFYETGQFESVGYDLGARGRLGSINEPLYTNGTLWHLGNNTTNSNVHINYIAARAIVPQVSSSVKIAVIDSGVQYGHYDFYNVSLGWDAENQSSPNVVSHPHGTMVTGFIAATPNNRQAVAGVAYGATIYPISFRVDSDPYNSIPDGTITSSYEVMVRAVDRAVSEGAKIINCSWTYTDNRVVNAVKNALDAGRIVVFASGNDITLPVTGDPVSSPANSDPRIIVVGAVNKNGTRASFSNYGSQLDVVAPGDGVTSTTVGSGYAYVTGISGTSFAAPQVSAIAALILSKFPNFTAQQVADIITSTASRATSGLSRNNEIGYGIVDAHKALFGHLVISGKSYPPLNWDETYSVPTQLPAGVVFNNWTVPSSGCTVTGGTNSSTLKIRFSTVGPHTIKANFTLPGNVPYSITKTLDLNVTYDLQPPNVWADPLYNSNLVQIWPPGFDVACFWSKPGQTIYFSLLGGGGIERSYEWYSNWPPTSYRGSTYTITPDYDTSSLWWVRCKEFSGNKESETGEVYVIVSETRPSVYRATAMIDSLVRVSKNLPVQQ